MTMRRLYTLLVWLALPLASALLLWRGLRNHEYWRGWSQRFGAGGKRIASAGRDLLWMHAVSVGEVQAALILLPALRQALPDVALLLSSATPAGRSRAEQAAGMGVEVCYAPYDLPFAVRRVLQRARPRLLLILETEVWPNLWHECARAGVPVLLVSARLSERSSTRFARFPGLLSPAALRNVTVLAQTDEDAARFIACGVPAARVQVAGNLKFDRLVDPRQQQRGRELRALYAGARPLWVAGSTHAGEEQAVLAAHRNWCAMHGTALLVIAPRHTARFGEVAALLAASGLRIARRSVPTAADDSADVLLLDTIGELTDFYAAADLAFVGGSLVPVGGHNLLEPAALGVATITGPQQFNAPDIARRLAARDGLRIVPTAAALNAAVAELLGDDGARARLAQAGQAVVADNGGGLARALAAVNGLLSAP